MQWWDDSSGELEVAGDHAAKFAHIPGNCPQLGRRALDEDHLKCLLAGQVDVK
jgi:hypothetical protein